MTVEQAIDAARGAGFAADALVTIVAICGRESGYNANAVNDTRRFSAHGPDGLWHDPNTDETLPAGISPEWSIGPLQINLIAHPDVTPQQAADWGDTFRIAWRLSYQGTDFSPWSTFDGLSPQELSAAEAAINAHPVAVDVAHSDPGQVELDEAQSSDVLHVALQLVSAGVPAYVENGPENDQITISVSAPRADVIASWPALADVLPA